MRNVPFFPLFCHITFYRQLSECPTCPSVECCRKTKVVPSFISVLYIIDLQATVTPVVAHISKVAWHGEQSPLVRHTPGFRPAD